jgi:hypothetical protein
VAGLDATTQCAADRHTAADATALASRRGKYDAAVE